MNTMSTIEVGSSGCNVDVPLVDVKDYCAETVQCKQTVIPRESMCCAQAAIDNLSDE